MNETPPSIIARHVIVSGRVQGVWFRGWTQKTARNMGLGGWVRNLASGTVEAVFIGSEKDVGEMIAACHNGPNRAQVTDVIAQDATSLPLPEDIQTLSKDFFIAGNSQNRLGFDHSH